MRELLLRATRILVAIGTPALACAAQTLDELRVGHWVKAKGALDERGVFVASEIEVTAPADEPALTGTVTAMRTPARFLLLGQEIHVAHDTRWRGIAAGDLTGARIKVEGDYHGPRKLSADTISRRDPGRDAIEARIDRLARENGVLALRLLHYDVRIASGAKLSSERPIAELALAPEVVFEDPLARRDEEDEVRGSLRLSDTLTLGGQIELEHERREEQDLNDARADRRSDTDLSLKLEAVWEPRDDLYFLASGRFTDGTRVDEDDPDEHDSDASLNEGYGYWRDAFGGGFDLQLGRQDFDERREWLYDQNLDAVRLVRSSSDLRVELAAASTLSDGSSFDEDSLHWLAYVSNNDFDRHLGAYVLDREEFGSPDRDTHLGVRAFGEWLPANDSWLELAWLTGESGGDDVGALGFDVGTTWRPSEGGPWFTLGFAFGAGDGDASGTFRQSSLADNTDKLGGVTSFQYYGELFDPELANLGVVTLGAGLEIARDTSLDLVLHRYEQDEALDRLVDTGLRRRPDGVHRDLGWEADLILGSRALDGWSLETVLGYFEPGDAFPGADGAWLARAQLRFRF